MNDTTRIQHFLKVLDHPKNIYAKNLMPKWYADSADYAQRMIDQYGYTKNRGLSAEYLRVLYICNHMCSNLVHLKHKPIPPTPSYVRREPEAMKEYQRMLWEYEYENTQAAISNGEGEIIQPGIHYTAEEFHLIREYVERMSAA